ncbi:PHP domain protein [Parasphaerochaeta coccoides DSM 17374]|uniref:PHP domain protein n=2 Tax=Parasphaerochaeta TaxID=3062336 RepID=F4GJ84_PARC1|nr:PHP domain protein [Parasphaerochaeta coccoides DSM 17374]
MIRSDFHVHTVFSDGRNTISDVLRLAAQRNIGTLAITDHFDPRDWRPAIASISELALLRHFQEIREESTRQKIDVLCGLETTPDSDGRLTFSTLVRQASLPIITSCHYIPDAPAAIPGEYFNDHYWKTCKEFMLQMALGEGDILGHCEDYLPIEPLIEGMGTTYEIRRRICAEIVDRYFDRPYVEKLADNLLSSGKCCELHSATRTPREWVVRLLAQRGVPFTPGSDAHGEALVGNTGWAYEIAERTGAHLISGRKELYERR